MEMSGRRDRATQIGEEDRQDTVFPFFLGEELVTEGRRKRLLERGELRFESGG